VTGDVEAMVAPLLLFLDPSLQALPAEARLRPPG
jgi:hypothetical protein